MFHFLANFEKTQISLFFFFFFFVINFFLLFFLFFIFWLGFLIAALNFFVWQHVSIWGFRNCVCLSVPREKKSSYLCQYQSYISNWYINGKVFTNTSYHMETPKNKWNFVSKKVKIEFWLVLKSWIIRGLGFMDSYSIISIIIIWTINKLRKICQFSTVKFSSFYSFIIIVFWFHYVSPSSGEAYRDRQLTNNFEFWVEFFFSHMSIPKQCLVVHLSVPRERNHPGFVNISPTLVGNSYIYIYIS